MNEQQTQDGQQTLDALRARHDALVASEPKMRIRERARRLGASEAQLVAAGCGLESTELEGKPQALFRELGTLGPVMALSRNDWCVHERHGSYEDIQADGMIGVVLGPDIDLRMFFAGWKYAYAVIENDRHSIQFFDKEGVAIHKVYRTEGTNAQAWDDFVARHARPGETLPASEAFVPLEESDEAEDPAALRAQWLALKDTHDFFPMLRKFRVSRLGALRAAGEDLAQPVGRDAAESILRQAAETGLSIMCFVANRGIVQIHTGPVQRLLRTGPWFNVLDPSFNLHLDTEAIDECWVVNKPTSDGWVTSLEAFTADGELIVQFFGARKPGTPELTQWRQLLIGLCGTALAA
ncbi:MAG TPA: ChuX/HutX family heme-like substrate-binding protein [Burkholderiaceae bacterium]|nr:ChuX/HutX family heme-like substrate-binding protein [Burkholderiaceae bacterium]